MAVDPITGLQNSTIQQSAPASADLGQVDFMKLIVAQMKNQNPLEPQSNTDFMAQMAQFESLNQMKTMADGMKVLQGVNELSSATSMLGKTVTAKQVDGTAVARDLVGRGLFGAPYASLTSTQKTQVNRDQRVQDAAFDASNAGMEVTGKVDRVVVGADGIPSLYVGGKVLDMFTVSGVQ
ncbi:MAG: flagellar hook capping FlgD N-terminal domain-containing protein [Tepidiformaceae bacterium]